MCVVACVCMCVCVDVAGYGVGQQAKNDKGTGLLGAHACLAGALGLVCACVCALLARIPS